MLCCRKVGVWLDEKETAVAVCREVEGHRWAHRDPYLDLAWESDSGTDVHGRRFLIDVVHLQGYEPATLDGDCGQVPTRDLASVRRGQRRRQRVREPELQRRRER